MMKLWHQVVVRRGGLRIVLAGAALLALGGCLGPNPGFFVSSSVANATIFNFVQRFWNAVLGA